MEEIECAVIGAGVVGLAAARSLARTGHEVVIIEAEDAIGTGTSSRNSEVIHAGIYYPPGSLKARLCVAGKQALYAYCDERGVPYRRCGKLIVAARPGQLPLLEKIRAQARDCGVDDLQWLDAAAAQRMEPALQCTGTLHSPSTGLIDSHALMLALLGDAQDHGAMLALKSPVVGGRLAADGILLDIGGDAPMTLRARQVVNCAGLAAQRVVASLAGFPAEHVPPTYYCKGNYYTLSGRAPFTRLIYPVPQAAGLGVHLTLDLAGQARFGPDVEWIDAIDYTVDPHRADDFYAAIRTYWPALPDGALAPGYAGIRPKVQAPGEAAKDFMIEGEAAHGMPGLVNLFGIESPGLTAALAIGDHVAAMLALA